MEFLAGMSFQGALGLIVIPALAWVLSEDKSRLTFLSVVRFGGVCLALQFALAAFLLYVPGSQGFFWAMSEGVLALQAATEKGLQMVFGYLAGGPTPFDMSAPQNSYLLAFRALPLILVISVLTRLLFMWGVLPAITKAMAWALKRTLGISGPVGLASAANVFVGMVEAPLLVRPYLASMSRGGLFALMTVGMATVAGTVLGLYASLLSGTLPGAAGHLMIASLISLPAALLISWLMVPSGFERGVETVEMSSFGEDRGVMDAISQGTIDGVRLMVLVTAMLVVMVALVALFNMALGAIFGAFGMALTFEQLIGWVMAPFAFLIGIPVEEMWAAGGLLGVKLVLNEFLAYLQLANTAPEILSERSRLILTYALCGFANFGSLGIMTGGLVTLLPERRGDVISLGPRTLISGTLATLMTGAVIGLLIP